jgi:uncharacterized protein (DUF488 family)
LSFDILKGKGVSKVLRRQKLLLAILHESKRRLTAIELVKLAFLVRHETTVERDLTFYDFVPYKYGPFSFALYRELEALQNNGYIDISDVDISISSRTRGESLQKARELSAQELGAARKVVSQYGKLDSQALVRYVYASYPWFTLNSELTELISESRPKRPSAPKAVYTSGYEGKSVDQFFDVLLRAGVRTVIDVRFNPMSRKYGFAGSSLRRIGEKLGIGYEHLPSLGISGEHREALNDFESYQELLNRYARTFLKKQEPALGILADLLSRSASALVCMEKDVRCCHRGRLATEISDRTGLRVVHL